MWGGVALLALAVVVFHGYASTRRRLILFEVACGNTQHVSAAIQILPSTAGLEENRDREPPARY